MRDPALAEKFLELLQSAYEADPVAMHVLVCNRVPCNEKLADHPHVVVDQSMVGVPEPYFSIGLLGIVNGFLSQQGSRLIGATFEDPIAGVGESRSKFVGFTIASTCPACFGRGDTDSGGFSPDGKPISIPCPECSPDWAYPTEQ